MHQSSNNFCLFLDGYNHRYKELPPNLLPRGLSRTAAAAYIGVSPTKFDEMVKDGRMPKPKRVDTRSIWDRVRLDIAFNELPGDEIEEANLWDEFQAAS